MSTHCPQEFVALAHRLADTAGEIIRRFFRSDHSVEVKQDGSPVTIADKKVEQALRTLINMQFPEHSIIGEEFGDNNKDSDLAWILDPIDGTGSFVTGKPIFGTLIALYQGKTPLLGVLDQPVTGERWFCSLGRCTELNGQTVQTRTGRTLAMAYLDATHPSMFTSPTGKRFWNLANAVRETRWGSDCYAFGVLATGFVDIVCETGLHFHDYAALVPIIEGAGGKITDWHGNKLGSGSDGTVLATGDVQLHQQALEILNKPQNNEEDFPLRAIYDSTDKKSRLSRS